MLKADKVARGRTCICGALIPQGETCVVEITGSGKWTRKRSLCRNCGTQAIIKERIKELQKEIQYDTKEDLEEKERARGRTEWIRQLRASLQKKA